MLNAKTNYIALKKCVLNDFPYSVEWNDDILYEIFYQVYCLLINEHSHINNKYYSINSKGYLNLGYIDHYVILSYRYSNLLWKRGLHKIADAVYYSLRVRGGIDLFYTTNIDSFFIPVHALGTVIDSHVKYGKLFKVYDGVHIGPYSIVDKNAKDWIHPIFGDYVTMLAGSKVFGKSIIGNNVIISTGACVINEQIPDNCIVYGSSPNLIFMKLKTPNNSILI